MRFVPLVVALTLVVVVATPLEAQEGRTYLITVTRDDGEKFDTCITFSDEGGGAWTVQDSEGDPFPGVWAHTNLNRNKKFWQAMLLSGTGSTAFHGKVTGGGKKIKGDALEAIGTTATFKGKADSKCVSKLRARSR